MSKGPKSLTPAKARERANLTQEQLARKAGVSLRTVTRMEASGKWPIWSTTKNRVQLALGLIEQDAQS